MIHSIVRRHLRIKFAILFYSILGAFLLGPILVGIGVSRDWFLLLLCLNLALALLNSDSRWLLWGLLPLGIALAALLSNIWLHESFVWLMAAPVVAALAFLSTINTFLHAMRTARVDSECIYAALSAYLLAGVCMAVGYWFLALAQPGAFLINGVASDSQANLSTFIYFSFVTLTTTGYGDILPVSEFARSLSIGEALVGQLYLASMVARLIGMYSVDAK